MFDDLPDVKDCVYWFDAQSPACCNRYSIFIIKYKRINFTFCYFCCCGHVHCNTVRYSVPSCSASNLGVFSPIGNCNDYYYVCLSSTWQPYFEVCASLLEVYSVYFSNMNSFESRYKIVQYLKYKCALRIASNYTTNKLL